MPLSVQIRNKYTTFAPQLRKTQQGEVLEWLKRHAWKACNRQNRFAGSNPVLSAEILVNEGVLKMLASKVSIFF